jgi:hypothetical protein
MRAIAVGLVLVAFGGAAGARQPVHTSDEGKYSVKFPGAPKLKSETVKSAIGDLTVNIATYANSDGNTFMVSFADFPEAATRPANLDTLFAGLRDGVKGRDGKFAGDAKAVEHGPDKLPGREFVVEKGKQRIRMRVLVRDNRVYQVAAIGTEAFATGKDGTAFLDSFQVTK